jgi:hypothetical protein
MTIRAFYKDLLNGLNLSVDDEDLITLTEPDGTTVPAVVNGRRLVFPSKDVLRKGIDDSLQPFHPLAESLSRRGVSPLLTYMKKTAHEFIAVYTVLLIHKLMEVAADPSLGKDLPPTCSEYLKKVPNASEQTLKKLDRLIRKASAKNALVTVYLKNGGKYNGKAVSRLCTIRFPIMDALDGPEMTIFGVKLTAKEKADISALFHYLIPLGDDPEEYSAGSDAKIAPFLEAFLTAFGKITKQLNKMVTRFAVPTALALTPFDQKFLKHIDKFPEYFSDAEIPSLRGNEGGLDKETPLKAPPSRSVSTHSTSSPPWDTGNTPSTSSQSTAKKETMQEWLSRLNPQTQPNIPAQHTGHYHQPQQQPQQSPQHDGGMYIPSWQRQSQYTQPQQPANPFRQAIASTTTPQYVGMGGYSQHHQPQLPQQDGHYSQPQSHYGSPPPRTQPTGFNIPQGNNNGSGML